MFEGEVDPVWVGKAEAVLVRDSNKLADDTRDKVADFDLVADRVTDWVADAAWDPDPERVTDWVAEAAWDPEDDGVAIRVTVTA